MRRSLIPGTVLAVIALTITGAWLLVGDSETDAGEASPQASRYNSLEVHLAVAREVPGFGGYFEDPQTGRLQVYLKDPPNERDAVIASLNRWFAGDPYAIDGIESKIDALQGEYNFGDLEEWKWKATGSVFSVPEVEYTDAQEIRNRVEIGITSYDAQPAVEEKLSEAGVPLEAVVFHLTEPAADDLDDYHRPTKAGLQIIDGHGESCTLGFAAMHQGDLGFVTASHCTEEIGEVDGEVFYQPYSPYLIGEEEVDPTPIFGGFCPYLYFCRFSDAVWADYAPGVSVSYGYIARPPIGSNNWNGSDQFRVIGHQSPTSGCAVVRMVGRTTGHTIGFVTNTWVNRQSGTNPLIIMVYQHRASYQRAGGDSGAPVFSYGYGGGDVLLHGLHWTGGSDSGLKCNQHVTSYAYFSDVNMMINELGLGSDLSYTGGP